MIKKLSLFACVIMASLTAIDCDDRIDVDCENLNVTIDAFRIHIGRNVWIETDTLHTDKSGFYTYESNVARCNNALNTQYVKKWKCPYCYGWYDVGSPCDDAACPSKYGSEHEI